MCIDASGAAQQKILGKWNCSADSDGIERRGKFTYLANGLGRSRRDIDVDAGAMKIVLTGMLDSTWGFNADGTMTESVTDDEGANAQRWAGR